VARILRRPKAGPRPHARVSCVASDTRPPRGFSSSSSFGAARQVNRVRFSERLSGVAGQVNGVVVGGGATGEPAAGSRRRSHNGTHRDRGPHCVCRRAPAGAQWPEICQSSRAGVCPATERRFLLRLPRRRRRTGQLTCSHLSLSHTHANRLCLPSRQARSVSLCPASSPPPSHRAHPVASRCRTRKLTLAGTLPSAKFTGRERRPAT
jgi:hypothetical protein